MMTRQFGLFLAPIADALKVGSAAPIVGEEWSYDISGSSTLYRFEVWPNKIEEGTIPCVMEYSYNQMEQLHAKFTKDRIVLNAMPRKWFVPGKDLSTINHRGPIFKNILQEMFKKRDQLTNADEVLPCPFNINIGSHQDPLPDEVKIAVLENDTFDEVARSLAMGLHKNFPIAHSLMTEGSLLSSYDFLTLKFAGEEQAGKTKLSDAGVEEDAVLKMFWKDDFEGSITFSNGDRYEGQFQNGKAHGQGNCTLTCGERYKGEYQNGKRHGQGILTWPDGDRYDGEFHNGQMHGQGIYTFANGDRYDGELKHGRGYLTYRDGHRYEGQFQNDKRHGHGIYIFANGAYIDA